MQLFDFFPHGISNNLELVKKHNSQEFMKENDYNSLSLQT